MAHKRNVSDLLAVGLFLIGFYILSSLMNILPILSFWIGIIGASILLVVEGWFLIKTVRRK